MRKRPKKKRKSLKTACSDDAHLADHHRKKKRSNELTGDSHHGREEKQNRNQLQGSCLEVDEEFPFTEKSMLSNVHERVSGDTNSVDHPPSSNINDGKRRSKSKKKKKNKRDISPASMRS